MSMEDLSSILWHERDMLDLLLFKLEVEQLVLTSGRTHWLARAAREIETALEEIRQVELLRAVAADALAAELGLEPNPSLQTIAETTASGWTTARRSSASPPASRRCPRATACCSPPATRPHRRRCCR
jgi:hypothetical protein